MKTLFSPKIFECFLDILKEKQKEINYIGDLSDMGNEIGYTLGKIYPDINEDDLNDFIIGLKHGISLTDGTH